MNDNIIVSHVPKKRWRITERQYYRYQIAMRESHRNAHHWLWFARKLAEYFVISVENRIEKNETNYVKKIQMEKNLKSIIAKDFIKLMEDAASKQTPPGKLGNVFLLPRSFAGSRKYYQEKYADLMRIANHYGNPTW